MEPVRLDPSEERKSRDGLAPGLRTLVQAMAGADQQRNAEGGSRLLNQLPGAAHERRDVARRAHGTGDDGVIRASPRAHRHQLPATGRTSGSSKGMRLCFMILLCSCGPRARPPGEESSQQGQKIEALGRLPCAAPSSPPLVFLSKHREGLGAANDRENWRGRRRRTPRS